MKTVPYPIIAMMLVALQALPFSSSIAEEPLSGMQRFAFSGLYAEATTCAAFVMAKAGADRANGDTSMDDKHMADITALMGLQNEVGKQIGKKDKEPGEDIFAEVMAMNEIVGNDLSKISILEERHQARCLKVKSDAASVFQEYLRDYKG